MFRIRRVRMISAIAMCALVGTILPTLAHASGTNCSSMGSSSICNTTNGTGMTVNWVAALVNLDACTPNGYFTYQHSIHDSSPTIGVPGKPAGIPVWRTPYVAFYHQKDPVACLGLGRISYYLPRYAVNRTFPTNVTTSCVTLYRGLQPSASTFMKASCNGVHP